MKIYLSAMMLVLCPLTIQAASHHKMVFVNQYDLDGDWLLYKEEFEHARLRRFQLSDENHDGVVSEQEYVLEYQDKLDRQLSKDRKGQIKQTGVRFKALDKNENERLEWEEYAASGQRSFNRYDVNKDGNIDAQDPEPERNRQAKQEKELTVEEQEKQRQRRLAFAKRVLNMPTTHDLKGMLVKYDANGDNVITAKEHENRRRTDFQRTDEDGNGWVSEQEYLLEFMDRMDKQISKTRKSAIKQTYVRYKVLDKNENGGMTFEEYQLSGNRSFTRWDTDNDQIVSLTEAMPPPRQRNSQPKAIETASLD